MTQPPDKTLELIERLRAKEHRGRFQMGGGTIGADGIATSWGGEKIMEWRNRDGPEAAALLASHHAAANELGYENFDAMVEGVRRLKAVTCAADYYIDGLEKVAQRNVIRDLGERKTGYLFTITNRSATCPPPTT